MPTLHSMATPRWLRKHRQEQRLAHRFGLREDERLRRLGPGCYVRSSRAELAGTARRQGARPYDPARFTWADDMTEQEWASFLAAVEEFKGRPLS